LSKRLLVLLTGALMAVVMVAMAGTAWAKDEKTVPGGSAGKLPAKAADAALDRALKKLIAMHGGPPGVIAVVQRGERRYVHSFGVADIESGRPMRVEDHMRLASTSKAFSGAVALSLVGKGELSVDDTIGEHLPELPEAWREITLRQLLNHTSGLPNFTEDTDYLADLQASPTDPPEPRELLTYVEDEPLNFVPGTDYRYSNTDNVTVGLIVEAVTGDSYEDQLQEQVFGPLGLEDTDLPRDEELPEPFIHGYDNDPSQEVPEDLSEVLASGWVWASGGMVSTPSDFNDFARGYVGGELFDRRTRNLQRTVVEGGSSDPPGPGKNSAGLGIFRYETKCGTVWGHTGNYPGYTQFLAASPDGKRSVTVSVNTQLSLTQGAPGVFEALRQAETLAVCAAFAKDTPAKPWVKGGKKEDRGSKKKAHPRIRAKGGNGHAHAQVGGVKASVRR
jgi:D-alanyl-D-alanine carboxypeptidase